MTNHLKSLLTLLASFIIGFLLIWSAGAHAGDTWTIRPRFPDFIPNDGIMEKGSFFNPYEIRDQRGQVRGIIRPRYPDLIPNDGSLDSGGWTNPYELKWEN